MCLHKTESGHFADDTYILFGSDKLGTIESTVNCELKLVSRWIRLNKLSLNTKKTELIFFRSKQHLLNYADITIKFNGRYNPPVHDEVAAIFSSLDGAPQLRRDIVVYP